MTTITKGHDILREVADFVEADENRHQQDAWANAENECGTTACIAGWTCILGTNDFFVQGKHYVPRMNVVRRWLAKTNPSEFYRNYKLDRIKSDKAERVQVLSNQQYFLRRGADLLGLPHTEDIDSGAGAWALFDGEHGPLGDYTTPQALRYIANGGDIEDVWGMQDEDDES